MPSDVMDARYWQGAFRTTRNDHYMGDPNSLSFAQVVQTPSEVTEALILSYNFEAHWLLSHFAPDTKVRIVSSDWEHKTSQSKLFPIAGFPNARQWTPPFKHVAGKGCMHIKLVCLTYRDGRVRIAIPTANMKQYEWDAIENVVWLIDLPPLPSHLSRTKAPESGFQDSLKRIFRRLDVSRTWYRFLKTANFGLADRNACLVASMEGFHPLGSREYENYGIYGLREALWKVGCRAQKFNQEPLHLTFQSSSVCVYSSRWLNSFYDPLHFDPPGQTILLRSARSAKHPHLPPIKLLYPTHERVERSLQGRHNACCRMTEELYGRGEFYDIAHDVESKRPGLVSHCKILSGIIQTDPSLSGKVKTRGFIMVGSHNFTKAAFGRIRDRTVVSEPLDHCYTCDCCVADDPTEIARITTERHLRIINHELSVILPIKATSAAEAQCEIDKLVPYRDVRKYSRKRQDRPFIMTEADLAERKRRKLIE